MIAEDDEVRARLAKEGVLFGGYHSVMEAVHRRNAVRLGVIVELYGWLGRSLVGEEASEAAWRIAQHAIGEPKKMRGWLKVLEEASERGEVAPALVAKMTDRIRVCEGRLQLYGTQFDWDDSGRFMVAMNGIEDPERLDDRRQRAGLPPFVARRAPDPEEKPPADLKKYREEMIAWAVKTGWR